MGQHQAHLAAWREKKGLPPLEEDEDLDEIQLDDLNESQVQVFMYFNELGATRGSDYGNPLRITYAEVYAWACLKSVALRHWELEAITRLDQLWLETYNGRSSEAEHPGRGQAEHQGEEEP